LAGPTAQASPGDTARTDLHPAATGRTEQHKVSSYWTADRMRSAKPRKVSPGTDWRPSSVRTGTATVVKGQPAKKKPVPTAGSYLGGPWTGGGAVVRTSGKVFFTEDGLDYVCSGSVVPAANKSTVTTAGHCVNEGPGAYVTNFAFVPAYNNGSAPYGVWSAKALATTTQWRSSGDINYDVGFAVVGQVNGRYLSDVVGSQSIGFNQPRGHLLYAFGYPQAAPYDGSRLDYCAGTAGNDTIGGTNDQRLACNMTGGSSGGPWLDQFSTSTGTGVQVSVNSFGYNIDKNAMYGPYFGSVVQSTYNTVQSAA
jgi:V8-like Glu-specific endopeptidase